MATKISVAITSSNYSSLASSVAVLQAPRRGRSTIARNNNVPNIVKGGFAGLQCRDCLMNGSLVSEMRGNQLRHNAKRATTRLRKDFVITPVAVETREVGSMGSNWNAWPSSPRSPGNTKGWMDERGNPNARLVAQLRNIALAARDRAELHTIIGLQRDNWNKLCHTTVVTTTVTAALLASLNYGATPALPLSLTAFLLNMGTLGLMVLAGKLQPSQLAEEQRSAARQCKAMAAEIESLLQIDPRLREDAHLYIEDKLTRLHDVDVAYPLPLTPNGLPKFPAVVRGSILNAQVDLSEPEIKIQSTEYTNGWSPAISEDLKQTSQKLRESDIEIYLGWARKKERESLRLAIGAPVLVAMAGLLNLLQCCSQQPVFGSTCAIAALCSVAGMFCFSFAQGGQIGMIFEMYRNCAGSYADLDNTIQRSIRIPVCQREDGELFHEKIALQLGRENHVPLVRPGDKTAGNVF